MWRTSGCQSCHRGGDLTNLPADELRVRRIARIRTPDDTPRAAIRRDGWWAVYAGIAQDPRGQLRAVALFDHTGEHAPTPGKTWHWRGHRLDDDRALKQALARYGVHVREPGQLPWVSPPD